jgi:MDMPI C-terminal domain
VDDHPHARRRRVGAPDAALTAGLVAATAPDLAADVVSEGLELLSAPNAATLKPELAALRGDGQRIGLRPAEPDIPGWTITRTPAGFAWERRTRPADVVLTGAVHDLLLVFTRRLPPEDARVTVTGDAALLQHWLAHTAF